MARPAVLAKYVSDDADAGGEEAGEDRDDGVAAGDIFPPLDGEGVVGALVAFPSVGGAVLLHDVDLGVGGEALGEGGDGLLDGAESGLDAGSVVAEFGGEFADVLAKGGELGGVGGVEGVSGHGASESRRSMARSSARRLRAAPPADPMRVCWAMAGAEASKRCWNRVRRVRSSLARACKASCWATACR